MKRVIVVERLKNAAGTRSGMQYITQYILSKIKFVFIGLEVPFFFFTCRFWVRLIALGSENVGAPA